MRSERITWSGGQHEFALPVPLLIALEERCGGDGVGLIFRRLSDGTFRVRDVLETLTLGLEGGGMAKADAYRLPRTEYEGAGLYDLAIAARIILGIALQGWPSDEADESEGEAGVETPETS